MFVVVTYCVNWHKSLMYGFTVNFVLVVILTHCSSYLVAPDDQGVPHNPANANASQGAVGKYRGVEK